MASKLQSYNDDNFENDQLLLKKRLLILKNELDEILQKTTAFEVVLRSHLENEIIEEQELAVLYRNIQKAKKLHRLAQKQKGKKFKNKDGLIQVKSSKEAEDNLVNQKERKRLYREAMLNSHPDLYAMNADKIDLANEITTELIEIYNSGSLEKLRDFHAHICTGNAFLMDGFTENVSGVLIDDLYLSKEIESIDKQLFIAKNKHTYKVLTEYENPFTFIEELKEFYADRIFKLKKRTRNSSKYEL